MVKRGGDPTVYDICATSPCELCSVLALQNKNMKGPEWGMTGERAGRRSGEGGAEIFSLRSSDNMWEWFKTSPEVVKTGHQEPFLYRNADQTLEQTS